VKSKRLVKGYSRWRNHIYRRARQRWAGNRVAGPQLLWASASRLVWQNVRILRTVRTRSMFAYLTVLVTMVALVNTGLGKLERCLMRWKASDGRGKPTI
jgi:hypothetical protein